MEFIKDLDLTMIDTLMARAEEAKDFGLHKSMDVVADAFELAPQRESGKASALLRVALLHHAYGVMARAMQIWGALKAAEATLDGLDMLVDAEESFGAGKVAATRSAKGRLAIARAGFKSASDRLETAFQRVRALKIE